MKKDRFDINYDENTETLDVGYDVNDDGTEDITLSVKVGVVLQKYWPHTVVAIFITALGVLKYLGLI